MSYKPRLTVYPTIRIRNVCAIFRMHVLQIQHRFYKFSTNFKVTRKFLQNKKLHLSESGVFYFPAGRKKAEYDRFCKSIDPASWNQAKECARGKSRKAKFVNQSGL